MFDRFVELQDRVLEITARSEVFLRDSQTRDAAALGAARWELTRVLREYQLFKHTRIFDPLLGHNDYRAGKAERMKAECIRVGDEFREYVLKWSVVSVADRWADYQPAAMVLLAGIRKQLARERIGVAELLNVKLAA